jgi:hypothetical protein
VSASAARSASSKYGDSRLAETVMIRSSDSPAFFASSQWPWTHDSLEAVGQDEGRVRHAALEVLVGGGRGGPVGPHCGSCAERALGLVC